MKIEIPIMFCFDNNYVIPAAVAFYSLLEHASDEYFYKLYVLHSDITTENINKLQETLKEFNSFSELNFIDMSNKFETLWQTIKIKGHFTKEVMYKILVASIFPQYDKLVVSDVDVVFLGDISKSYLNFDINDDYYLSGIKAVGKVMGYMDNYKDTFTNEEIEMLSQFCGGYIIFNLNKLRKEKMEDKFIECFQKEGYRLNQMEQDVLNLCCYPKIKLLPLNYVVCSYMWNLYQTEDDFVNDLNYLEKDLKDAMNHPIQLHYATSIKPWKNIDCTKSEEWFKYIVKTPFLKEYLKKLSQKMMVPTNSNKTDVDFIKRIFNYIKKNPTFFINDRFYKKLFNKVYYRINKTKSNEIPLLIIDDSFPNGSSCPKYEEFMMYLNNIYKSKAILTSGSFTNAKIQKCQNDLVTNFIKINPEFKYRLNTKLEKDSKIKLAILGYLDNVTANLSFLEENNIPFVFSLELGKGFTLNNKKSDCKLNEVFSSVLFRKVIVSQQIVRNYLIDKKLCDIDRIKFIDDKIINDSLHKKCFLQRLRLVEKLIKKEK